MANLTHSQQKTHSKLVKPPFQSKYKHGYHFKQTNVHKPLSVIVSHSKGPIFTMRKHYVTNKTPAPQIMRSKCKKSNVFNPNAQSSETWTMTETKSMSTRFKPASINSKQSSNVRKYPNKPLPSIATKQPKTSTKNTVNVQKHGKHQRNRSLSVSESSCEIEEYVCCVDRMSTKSSLYSKASDDSDYNFPTKKYKHDQKANLIAAKTSSGTQSECNRYGGVTADELLRLISCGECASDSETEMSALHVSEPHPHHIPCASDVTMDSALDKIEPTNTTTVIPSILTMSPDTNAKNTPPAIGLSNSASQNGDTLVYNVLSYSVTDESTDIEEDSHNEVWKLAQSLTALHHNINSVALCDVKH